MARPKGNSLNAEAIIDQIEDRLKNSTLDHLSMSELAKHLNIKTPSLYSHFNSLQDLKDGVTFRALGAMASDLRTAIEGKAGKAKLIAFMKAYREFAHRNPLLFDATQYGIRRDNEGLMVAAHEIVQLAIGSLEGWGISEARVVHAVRILRSLLNGFISLELQGGFQRRERPEKSFEDLIEFTERGLKGF